MAINENKDQNEMKVKEEFLVHRAYAAFMRKKMKYEMAKAFALEEAFQKIRTATNFKNVNELVHRFMTRE